MVIASHSRVNVASKLRGSVNCVEMELLTIVCDIYNPGCLLLSDTVAHGSDICGVIAIATVSFLDHERYLTLGNKNTLGTITDCHDTTRLKVF